MKKPYCFLTHHLKNNISVLLAFILMFCGATLFAQDNIQTNTYTGRVLDTENLPLPGVTVQIANSTQGTVTDISGNFSISAAVGDSLSFTMLGFDTYWVQLGERTQLDIVLSEAAASNLETVVVVGYGTSTKRDLTGSVGHIGKEILETRPATNLTEYLSGTIAGFNSHMGNTASGGASMQVRGPNSLRASTDPLVVLDGVIYYGKLEDINPNDIESIDVLKDASSAAIYGSRGAAGVVMVTTKKGTSDVPRVNFDNFVGTTSVANLPELLGPQDYINVRRDYFKTQDYFTPETDQKGLGYFDNPDNLPEGVTKEQWAAYDGGFSGDYTETWLNRLQFQPIEIENYKSGRTINWNDHVFRNGIRQNYNLNISGKSGRTSYFTSLGYVDNQGMKVGDDYKNVRGRVNIDSEINDWLTFGINAQYADRSNETIMADSKAAEKASPFGSMFDESGNLLVEPHGDQEARNPLTYTLLQQRFGKAQTFVSTLYSKLTLPLGITAQVNYNNRYGWSKNYSFSPQAIPSVPAGGQASRAEFSDYEWMLDAILKWDHTFSDIHRIDATFVANAEKYQSWQSTLENDSFFPNAYLVWHNMKAGLNPQVGSNDEYQTGNAMLGRINYYLKDRYILTASVRRDGFSAFGKDNPYATFPALAAAWRISGEPFMEGLNISNLKLRASWGINGNREFGRYAALSRLATTQNIIGGETITGVWTENLSNYNLRWEKTTATNIGLDFGFWNERLSGTIDVYDNKTNDLLLTRALPSIIGYTSVAANLGQVNNRGLELTLSHNNITNSNLRWASTFIYSTNKNKITSLYGNMIDVEDEEGNVIGQREADDPNNGWYIGHGIHDIYDYKFMGIWQLGEEEDAARYGKRPGDPKLLDVNDDGKLDPDNDRLWLGSGVPKHRMSLRNDFRLFNDFSVSFLLKGEFGFMGSYNFAKNDAGRGFNRFNTIKNDYWTPWGNPSNEYGKLGSNTSSPGFNIYRKRDYVRLQNFSVAYSLPARILNNVKGIKAARLSLNVDNGLLLTDWPYYDPENLGSLPRTITFGLNVTL